MTRKLSIIDRLILIVIALGLGAAAAAALDWHFGWSGRLEGSLTTDAIADADSASWWAGATTAATVVLALIAVWWLLAHLPRRSEGVVPLDNDDDAHGTRRVDLRATASAVADSFGATAPVSHTRGTVHRLRGTHVIDLRADLDPRGDTSEVRTAVESLQRDLAVAFPDGTVQARVLLGQGRHLSLPRRSNTIRVVEARA